MDKILFVPLDERPCNFLFPKRLIVSTKGIELIEPDKEMLGKKKTPSNFALLKKFILDNVKDCSCAVISIDQLLYGGIVPSRIHHLSEEELEERLSLLKDIKKINPNIILYCFILIMRCPSYSSSDEEPDYYEYYGETINKIGSLIDTKQPYKHLLNDEIEGYLNDYVDRRKKNLKFIKKTVEYTKDVIDFLIIPQDDSQTTGFTMMDRREVLDVISNNNCENIEMYPGADEIGLTLIARAINALNNSSKSFYLDFLYDESKNLIPAFENRPLLDTISHHINASNNIITNNIDNADVVLFLNYDRDIQRESIEPGTINKDDCLKQISRMIDAKNKGKLVSLADKTYVNGGNIEYMKLLSSKMNIDDLDVYGGWNTSSNTLGTVISFSTALSYSNNKRESSKFLAERIYDDLIYQSYVRKYIRFNILPTLGLTIFDIEKYLDKIQNDAKELLESFTKENFNSFYNKYHLKKVIMPWKRMFEVEVEVK